MIKDKIFDVIEELSNVKLSSDPADEGLILLNEKIAEISNKRSRAGILSNKIQKALYEKKRRIFRIEDAYQLRFDRLMAYDRRIKSCSNKSEMESLCRSILHREFSKLRNEKLKLTKLETYEKCMNNCLKTLQHSKESIAKQMSVISYQMNLGEIDRMRFSNS